MARNPYARAGGRPAYSDEVRAQLLRRVRLYLEANADRDTVPDPELRALDPLLALPGVWQDVRDTLGL